MRNVSQKNNNDERFYDIRRLNKIFAVSSVLLLIGFIAMVAADHKREWKRYQRDFRALEVAKLEQALEAERKEADETEDPKANQNSAADDEFWGTNSNSVPADDTAEAVNVNEQESLDPKLVKKKIAELDPETGSWTDRIAAHVRNLPFLDFASPSVTIEQIIVQDAKKDMHFDHAPRVDRCTTCHQAMLRPDFSDEDQPFASHPNLDLFIASDSPHPMERFGCTLCHDGRGRGTSFASAAHTPGNETQRNTWEEELDWHEQEHWPEPMLPRRFLEARCLQCHKENESLPGAETLMLGKRLIERAGCYGCHPMEQFDSMESAGPSLANIAGKTTPEWVREWLRDPSALRPRTWMPHFFPEGETQTERARQENEIQIITAFLFQRSVSEPDGEYPANGDSARGRELIMTSGCLACHRDAGQSLQESTSLEALLRDHGPPLSGLSSKTNPQWLFRWLKNPAALDSDTPMPNLGLTDRQAADIVAYLMRDKAETDVSDSIDWNAPPHAAELANLAYAYGGTAETKADFMKTFNRMDTAEKIDAAGESLVRYYGCAGCHEIPGLDDAVQNGPELSRIGEKTADDFDFGGVHSIPRTNYGWITKKLADSRAFQKTSNQDPFQRLRMPQYAFTEHERQAVVTALLGMVDAGSENDLVQRLTPAQKRIADGRRLVRQKNCRGCHVIEDGGGVIRPLIETWYTENTTDLTTDPVAVAAGFTPPNLNGEGNKVRPAWLFDYLADPQPIRPWLTIPMPQFGLTESERNTVVAYFAALDDTQFPFESEEEIVFSGPLYEAGAKLFSPDYFDCGNCHIRDGRMPSGTAERWAPDFAVSAERLRPAWVRDFLYDPQKIMPGTRMPTFFDPQYFDEAGPENILGGDEHRHIEALKNFVFTIGHDEDAGTGTTNESSGKEKGPPKEANMPSGSAEHDTRSNGL